MKTTITLVLITSTHSCLVDNVSDAKVERIPMQNMELCEAVAADLDRKQATRAYCEASE